MGGNMALTSMVDQARRWHEQLYTDKCIITRKTGTNTDDAGVEHDTMTPVADTACVVQRINAQASDSSTAGDPIQVATHVCKTPIDTDIRPGDQVTVTESHDTANMKTWYVVDVEQQSWSITRKAYLVGSWRSPSTPHS